MSTTDSSPSPQTKREAEWTTQARRFGATGLLHLLLVAMTFSLVLPFLWMVLTSLKPLAEVGVEGWLPSKPVWSNYAEVFRTIPFARYYWNSIFVAAWVTFLQVFTSSLAAFSFSRIRWPGRDRVFLLYLATMMVPGLVMMIPNYQIMISLGLVDRFTGLILPAAFSAFGTFLLRQFMLTIPTSLDEAAEADGATKWRIYWDIILPLSRPGLITLSIFTFIGNYQSLFWPLVMLKSTHRYTLPIGLLFFDSTRGQSTHLLMASVTMSIVPMVLLFVVLQKYLVRGIQMGAVKG
jgi:multiple sugar transport system permease protein